MRFSILVSAFKSGYVVLSSLVLFVGCFLSVSLSAQVNIELRNHYPRPNHTLSYDAYPRASAWIKVTTGSENAPRVVSSSDVFVREGSQTQQFVEVSPPTDGFQKVEWNSVARSTTVYWDDPAVQLDNQTFVGVTLDGLSAVAQGRFRNTGITSIRYRDSLSREIRFAEFGDVRSGDRGVFRMKFLAAMTPFVGGKESKARIDSITIEPKEFSYKWIGLSGIGSPHPPTEIFAGIDYRFDLYCNPTQAGYLQGTLTMHHSGGARETLILRANSPKVTPRDVIKITNPRVGDVLTPCAELAVQWVGTTPGYPVYVEVSMDGGRSWAAIGESKSNELIWRIPDQVADSVVFRISQLMENDSDDPLEGENAIPSASSFNGAGTRAIVAYGNNRLREFDVNSRQAIGYFSLPANSSGNVVSVSYIGKTDDLVIAVRQSSQRSLLVIANTLNAQPEARIELPPGFAVADVFTDSLGTTIYAVPEVGPVVYVYNRSTGAYAGRIGTSKPITAAAWWQNSLALFTLDGRIHKYSLPDNVKIDEASTNFPHLGLPFVSKIALSPTGRYLVLGGITGSPMAPGTTGSQSTYVYDSWDKKIIHYIESGGVKLIGAFFSENEAKLALGFNGGSRATITDLLTFRRVGTIDGLSDLLTSVSFSASGRHLLACSNIAQKNTRLKSFVTPEQATMKGAASVRYGSLVVKPKHLGIVRIMERREVTVQDAICNNSDVAVFIRNIQMQRNTHMRLTNSVDSVLLMPGECIDVSVTILASDTGSIEDILVVNTCGPAYNLPLSINVQDRKISLMSASADFGNVCRWTTREQRMEVIRNDDDIPLTVSYSYIKDAMWSFFSVATSPIDTVIPPAGTLSLTLRYRPLNAGPDTGYLIINYESQTKVDRRMQLTGYGLGGAVEPSHRDLPFIPEIQVRRIELMNNGLKDALVSSVEITPAGDFDVVTPLPINIPAGSVAFLEIRCNTASAANAELFINIDPCGDRMRVNLMMYNATAQIILPQVTADPRGEAEIPIHLILNSKHPYKGERTYQGAISVNPRLFIATSAESAFGTATIVSQDIVNDARIIRFHVTGDFSSSNVLVLLKGPAGIAETDWSPLLPVTDVSHFGSAVSVVVLSGSLTVQHPERSRRIQHPRFSIVPSVWPNPADGYVKIALNDSHHRILSVSVADATGRVRVLVNSEANAHGTVSLDCSQLEPAVYNVTLNTTGGVISRRLIVVR